MAAAPSEAPVAPVVQSQVKTMQPQQQNMVDATKLQEANKKAEEVEKKLTLVEQEKLRIQKVELLLYRSNWMQQ